MKYKLSEVMDLIGGGTPKTSKTEYWNGDIPWLSVKDFNNGFRYVYETEKSITQLGLENSSTKLLQKGDVIISARGTVGEIATIPFPMAFNQSCYGLRAKSGIVTSDYLYYLIKHNVSVLKKNTHGSVFDTITRSTFDNIVVEIPSIEIQEKIASILSDYDEKIELNNAINNNLEQQASVLVRQYCESLTSSVELGTVLSFENGFAFQSSSYHEKGKYRIITIKNVQDGRIDAQGAACIDDIPPHMKQGCFLTIGDVLLSLTGNVGRVGIVCENDLLLNQRVAKFIPKDIRTLPLLYFYFRLHSTKISLETISKGTAQQNLSPIETLKLEIPYETKQALELSNLLQPIFDTIYQKNIENIQLAEIRDSLLPKLMSGELDVSDIDI